MDNAKTKWGRIALYLLTAFAGSALYRFVLPHPVVATGPWSIYRNLIGGLGPALGALGVYALFRYRPDITLWGTSGSHAAAMIAIPPIVMGTLGVPNGFGVDPHVFGIDLGMMVAVYAVLEEMGWRGYLQSELGDLPWLLRYALIGIIWYAWHFSWVERHPIGDQLFTIGFMIAASIGIGFVADRTHAVLAAAAFHVIGDVMGLMPDFRALIPDGHQRIVIVAVCVLLYLVVMRLWRMHDVRQPGRRSDRQSAT